MHREPRMIMLGKGNAVLEQSLAQGKTDEEVFQGFSPEARKLLKELSRDIEPFGQLGSGMY